MSEYFVTIKATVNSNLSAQELGKRLVIALYDTEKGYSKLDNVDEELSVIDYIETVAQEICPRCSIPLENRMIDVDGRNLQECLVYLECGYGTPSLR
ncbi:hypothetical protein H7170_02500 [Candidatus Gracilibacteria bacterium]|nr:hypothetical protein [Candidatus Gracilibacteria bacterium]